MKHITIVVYNNGWGIYLSPNPDRSPESGAQSPNYVFTDVHELTRAVSNLLKYGRIDARVLPDGGKESPLNDCTLDRALEQEARARLSRTKER